MATVHRLRLIELSTHPAIDINESDRRERRLAKGEQN